MSTMRYMSCWVGCAALLAGLAGGGCGKKEPAGADSAPLAQVGAVAITEADFAFEVRRRQETGRPMGDSQTILKDLIERQAMLQKAESSEIMQDPAIRRELENKQLGQWLDRSLQVERDAVRVTDEDLRAHYDAHPEAYTRPAMSRLALLYRRVNLRDSAEDQAALREELAQARAAFLADPAAATQNGQMSGFGALAARFSEDPGSRYRGGDIGWLEETGEDRRQPAAVIDAGLALAVGAVSDVMSAGDGLYVVMKTDWRPARVVPFDEVAPALRRQLIRLRQEEVERGFMDKLMAETKISINADKAAKLTVPSVAVPAPPELRSIQDLAPQREEFE